MTIDDARAVASPLARSYEAVVRNRLKFRVGQIVYVAFSRDESLMGFAFPREYSSTSNNCTNGLINKDNDVAERADLWGACGA